MSGILYGIGVGPGDPELMTLKAVRYLRESDLVILPSEPKEECFAYRIAKEAVPQIDEKEIWCRSFPMIREKDRLKEAHDGIYKELKECLEAGKSIAFLTIGDPSVYSTFSYMNDRAKRDGIRTEISAGVPSFCGAAARLKIALGESAEEIHVIPGSSDLEASLKLSGTRIYMKSGKQLKQLKELLEKRKQEKEEIYAVSDCGLPSEQIRYGLSALDTDSPYLTIVIVKPKKC